MLFNWLNGRLIWEVDVFGIEFYVDFLIVLLGIGMSKKVDKRKLEEWGFELFIFFFFCL